MKDKKIIPTLELDSNQFEEKVLISLEKTGNVRIVPKNLSGRKEEINRFLFALMNTGSSKRILCPACCGKHRYFVKSMEIGSKEDEKGLCDSCGVFMTNMALLGVPMEKIKEWMTSKGEIDPYELMRDAIQDGIKKGDITMDKVDLDELGKKRGKNA